MKFNYQARTAAGETISGVIEASHRDSALQLLARRSLYVTFLEEAGREPFFAKRIEFFNRISLKDIVNFSRQLSIMFQAQVPLVETLQTISAQTRNISFREKILKIADGVEAGAPLSQSLAEHPAVFSRFYVNMVKSGEASGKLSEVIEKLADHLEREYDLMNKIRGALVYPIFVLVLGVAVLFLMVYFIIPNITELLQETDQELPVLTKATIGAASFLRRWGFFFLPIGGILIAVFLHWKNTKEGRRIIDKILLKFPVVRSTVQTLYLSRFAENLSTLIAAGLPITQALEIAASTVGNVVYEEAITQTKQAVLEGSTIANSLEQWKNEFPPTFTQMIRVGEKAGRLDQTLANMAIFYQKEVTGSLDVLLGLLEPVLIVILGLGVAFMMAAILIPLYQISSS